jgi:hypothetical protein
MTRHPLGSLVAQGRVVCTVVGTWRFEASGFVAFGSPPRDTKRVATYGRDPLTDDEARGYVLLPSVQGEAVRLVSWDEPLTFIA